MATFHHPAAAAPFEFGGTFVINLDADVQRLAAISKRLERVGIRWERFPAVSHADPVRGCTASHSGVVREARSRGYGSALVFEDDAVFRAGFRAHWDSLLAQLAAVNWDLFYPYDWARGPGSPPDEVRLVPLRSTICCHCWAINSRFYDRFLSVVDDNRHRHIDTLFDSTTAAIFGSAYNLVGQDAGPSRISRNNEVKKLRWSRYEVL